MSQTELKQYPFWWDTVPGQFNQGGRSRDLPVSAETVIVGSGITGLVAALNLAREQHDVLVIDSRVPGSGASSRNAGYVAAKLFDPPHRLVKKFGENRAVELSREAHNAFDYLKRIIREEQIDCDFEIGGRIYWAYTQSQLEELIKERESLSRIAGIDSEILGPSRDSGELDCDHYCAGLLVPSTGALNPARYLYALLTRLEEAGGQICGNTQLLRIRESGDSYLLETTKGSIKAKNVIIATNGYVGKETPFLRRRIVPVIARMIAAGPVDEEILTATFPHNRTHLDRRSRRHYWRLSPDRRYLLFGGQTAWPERTDWNFPERLRDELVTIFPHLDHLTISHYWNGLMGMTFDQLPHIGQHKGILFAMGMNGHGVPMGSYLGYQAAIRVMEGSKHRCVFYKYKFPTRPGYFGRPWFMPIITRFIEWAHRREKAPGES